MSGSSHPSPLAALEKLVPASGLEMRLPAVAAVLAESPGAEVEAVADADMRIEA